MQRLASLALVALVAGCAPDAARERDRPFTAGVASVERLDVVVAPIPEAYVRVVARGALPDACTRLDRVVQERRGRRIDVTLTTRRGSGSACAQGVRPQPFARPILIPTDDLLPGLYTLDVNGVSGVFEVVPDEAHPRELHERAID